MRLLAALAALLLLVACRGEPSGPDIDAAKATVAAKFTYSSGAEFRGLHHPKRRPNALCGEVRGRMANGEMTDFRRFAYDPRANIVEVEGLHYHDRRDPSYETLTADLEELNIETICG